DGSSEQLKAFRGEFVSIAPHHARAASRRLGRAPELPAPHRVEKSGGPGERRVPVDGDFVGGPRLDGIDVAFLGRAAREPDVKRVPRYRGTNGAPRITLRTFASWPCSRRRGRARSARSLPGAGRILGREIHDVRLSRVVRRDRKGRGQVCLYGGA